MRTSSFEGLPLEKGLSCYFLFNRILCKDCEHSTATRAHECTKPLVCTAIDLPLSLGRDVRTTKSTGCNHLKVDLRFHSEP